MEKTKTKSDKKGDIRHKLKEAYIKYVLSEDTLPKSIYAFAEKVGVSEADFYGNFSTLNSLERAIWADWFAEVRTALSADDNFSSFTFREKILSVYYTWFEKLLQNRSFALYQFEHAKRELDPSFLKKLKDVFQEYMNELVNGAIDSGEIKRNKLSEQYASAFWVQFLFVSKFWLNDESEDFQKTDAAIEKSVNLAFDFIGTGPLDRLVDFAKFLYQNQKPF